MKVRINHILLILDLILNFILYYIDYRNNSIVLLITLFTIFLIVRNIIKYDNSAFSYSTVLLLYIIFSQFGLFIPYILFGKSVLSNYTIYTLRFLDSSYFTKSIILGNIGVIVYEIARRYIKVHLKRDNSEKNVNLDDEYLASKKEKMYIVSIYFLIGVAFFFSYYLIRGGLSIFASYESYTTSAMRNNFLYSYILIIYYAGTLYLAGSGDVKNRKFGWAIWLIIALFFMLTGNRGEFLYALLAVLGMKGLGGIRMKLKTVIMVAIILFVIIPSIGLIRNVGISKNLSSIGVSFVDPFVEMGMQVRTTVYTLEDLNNGSIEYLYGESYWRPITNIIFPINKKYATSALREKYVGHGYNQLAESYLNFGVIGVLIYFSLIGLLISGLEKKRTDCIYLAYIGTITCIFINATRNYFAFVPGQIIIVTFIYLFVKLGSKSRKPWTEIKNNNT